LGANYFDLATGKTGEPPPVSDEQIIDRLSLALN
jgi:hypothetical protein